MTLFKIVEASTVTDETLERIVNEWVGQGWTLDGMQFAMRESSKRPAMAFVVFTREAPLDTAEGMPEVAVADGATELQAATPELALEDVG